MPDNLPNLPFGAPVTFMNDDGSIGWTLPAGWTLMPAGELDDPVRHPEGRDDPEEYA